MSWVRAVVDQIVDLGPGRVVLTGGEPTLHPEWSAAARALGAGGARVTLFAGGPALAAGRLDEALSAGVEGVHVSLDGPPAVHDALRPRADGSSFAATRRALEAAVGRVRVRVVTSVGRLNAHVLPWIYDLLVSLRVPEWQVQLVQGVGRASHHPEALPPRDIAERVVVALVRAARERRIFAPLHCSVGYLVPEDVVLRYRRSAEPAFWRGSQAGQTGLAVLSDGAVVGCPCLPASFAVARTPERSLVDIWRDDDAFPYSRRWDPSVLVGGCAACALGPRCRAGCLGVAFGVTGTIGNNPYCLRQVRGAG